MPLTLWRVPEWPFPGQHGSAVILLYHSIANRRSDPWGLRVSPRHFAEHMMVLRSHCHPMSLTELHARMQAKDLPPRSVAVTFDDAYSDNLHRALPILSRFGIAATVFVPTGYVGANAPFWWDELEEIMLRTPRLPAVLNMHFEQRRSFRLNGAATLGRWRQFRLRNWRAWHEPPSMRHRIFNELRELLKASDVAQREACLAELRQWARTIVPLQRTGACVSRDELRRLASNPLIEIGAHTVHHPSLAEVDRATAEREITQSRTWLETELGKAVTRFAYPYGDGGDTRSEVQEVVAAAGFEHAYSTQPYACTLAGSAMSWPRFMVLDWPGEEFAQRLCRWFDAAPAPAPSVDASVA